MSKRTMEEANNEISEPENTISDNQLTKKIKLQQEKILLKIKETNEETDGFVTHAILQIVNVISALLKNNIDDLKVPEIVKTALKS